MRDVVGLYLDPPHNAAVFSFDEKSQIQALDRTQPGLPMKKGRCATMTHDYKRHGTTTLFAALNMATGQVIGKTYRKHRHQEVLRFLREVEKTVPKEQEIHIVLDNYATHKHEKVLAWIERKQRVFLHFIPTSASWANLVERFFGILTQKKIRRGVFTSVPHLEKCLREYLESLQRESTRPGLDKVRRGNPSKRSVGVERSYPKPLNHYFVKDTALAVASIRASFAGCREVFQSSVHVALRVRLTSNASWRQLTRLLHKSWHVIVTRTPTLRMANASQNSPCSIRPCHDCRPIASVAYPHQR